MTEKGIKGGFKIAKTAIEILLTKIIPINKILCEPHMGKRGLYPNLSKKTNIDDLSKNYMNFLQYADGKNDLSQISKLINLSQPKTKNIYYKLKKNKLIT